MTDQTNPKSHGAAPPGASAFARLRDRNVRRALLAQMRAGERQRRVEQAMQVARQRRFRQS